jgi:hypothetical protein
VLSFMELSPGKARSPSGAAVNGEGGDSVAGDGEAKAKVGPGRKCSKQHRVSFDSTNEGWQIC